MDDKTGRFRKPTVRENPGLSIIIVKLMKII